mmetsp:Transcript_11373/g.25374  ORF Transcript_11373/g.25374 Transcript_11373/m.25374 type:complete len:217 (+) Transcript_11373:65-715(+)
MSGRPVSMPKLLSSSSTMSSTASTASADSVCHSVSESPKSSRSVDTQDAWPKEAVESLPQSYLPGWCVKNTFVDFQLSESSTRRRRASAPPACSSARQVALEDLRQQLCPRPGTTLEQAGGRGSTPGDAAPYVVLVPMNLLCFPSIGSVGHYNRQCTPCAFVHTKGCETGAACRFCHLCDKSEKKRRQKQKFGKGPLAVKMPHIQEGQEVLHGLIR